MLILNSIGFVTVAAFSNNAYAQEELHQKTLYEIANHTSSHEIPSIPVGKGPSAIGVNLNTNTIYVANKEDNTVSVIDGKNNSKIGKDIPVGKGPSAIGVNTNTIYVANKDDNTVSVIDINNNKNIGKDIPVGNGPSAISVNWITNSTYIAERIDNAVSVIDSKSNKVVTRVMFNVEPFNSGHIECDNVKSPSPLLQQFYLYSGAKCTAKPNPGFEFVSWQENLNGNSTQLLQLAPAPSILDSILDLFHMKPDKPEATLNISKFGSFTANFKSLPPPVPPEYIATLFTVVVTAFVGTWLIPTVIGWRKSRNQGKKLDYYYNEINNLKTNVLEENGKIPEDNLTNINNSRIDIEQQYTRGKINKEQFDKLSDDLSKKYREMFKNEIDYLNNLPEYNKENRLSEIKKDIENAYADEKINEMHYKLLKENISGFEKK